MQRVLFGLFCALLAGVAELWFLLRIAIDKEEKQLKEEQARLAKAKAKAKLA